MNKVDPLIAKVKTDHMTALAEYTEELYKKPDLRHLFLELTNACNERCFHCGSNCSVPGDDELTTEEFKSILDQVREDFDGIKTFSISSDEVFGEGLKVILSFGRENKADFFVIVENRESEIGAIFIKSHGFVPLHGKHLIEDILGVPSIIDDRPIEIENDGFVKAFLIHTFNSKAFLKKRPL